jgi:hypothetical protein
VFEVSRLKKNEDVIGVRSTVKHVSLDQIRFVSLRKMSVVRGLPFGVVPNFGMD